MSSLSSFSVNCTLSPYALRFYDNGGDLYIVQEIGVIVTHILLNLLLILETVTPHSLASFALGPSTWSSQSCFQILRGWHFNLINVKNKSKGKLLTHQNRIPKNKQRPV